MCCITRPEPCVLFEAKESPPVGISNTAGLSQTTNYKPEIGLVAPLIPVGDGGIVGDCCGVVKPPKNKNPSTVALGGLLDHFGIAAAGKERQSDYAWRKALSSTPRCDLRESLALTKRRGWLWLHSSCPSGCVNVSILEANSYTFSRRVDLPYTFLVAGNHFRDATKMVAGVTNAESFSLLTCCFQLRLNCKNTYEILASRIPNGSDYKSCLQILLAIFSRYGTVLASKASLVRFDAKPRAIRPSVNLR